MPGPVYQVLADDHRRMEALLALATADPGNVDLRTYGDFRSALLRHIGMEEKILIPAALRAGSGKIRSLATKIRFDHGALAALLVPPPDPEIITIIRAVLAGHNLREEGLEGLYETCERLAGHDIAALLERLMSFPPPRLKPHVSGRFVLDAARRALARAGYDWDVLVKRTSF